MTRGHKNEEGIDKPPFFKRWRSLYLFVLLIQALLILLFHWLSSSFG